MKYLSKEFGENIATNSEAAFNNATSGINWDDYNYPPCLNLFHYVPSQTPDNHIWRVRGWQFNHLLILVINFVNLIANIVATAQGMPLGGFRIGISVFVFLFFLPVSFYIFVLPYQIVMKGQTSFYKYIIFYCLCAFVFIFYAIWSIANFADANGFVAVADHFSEDRAGAGVFGLVVSIGSLIIAVLTIVNTITFFRR